MCIYMYTYINVCTYMCMYIYVCIIVLLLITSNKKEACLLRI